MIKIQKNNFSLDKEIDLIKSKNKEIGAVSTFVGYVRNINQNKKVNSIYLEVYENMAFKSLEKICNESKKRWDLIDTLVIHRFHDGCIIYKSLCTIYIMFTLLYLFYIKLGAPGIL